MPTLLGLLAGQSFWVSLVQHSGPTIFGQPIPAAVILATITFVVLTAVAVLGSRSLSVDRPGHLQQVLEVGVGGFAGLLDDTIPHHGRHHIRILGTLGAFILVSNLLGLVPSVGAATAYVSVPAALALTSFTYYNVVAVKEVGIVSHLKHFAGPVWWLFFIMVPIELVSHLVRNLSLTMRLFGNIYGEHQASAVFYNFADGFIVPIPMMFLGIFASFLQAFVFCLLSMVYITLSTEH